MAKKTPTTNVKGATFKHSKEFPKAIHHYFKDSDGKLFRQIEIKKPGEISEKENGASEKQISKMQDNFDKLKTAFDELAEVNKALSKENKALKEKK